MRRLLVDHCLQVNEYFETQADDMLSDALVCIALRVCNLCFFVMGEMLVGNILFHSTYTWYLSLEFFFLTSIYLSSNENLLCHSTLISIYQHRFHFADVHGPPSSQPTH